MNQNRKPYTAPAAELICFAPCEAVAAWGSIPDSDKWWLGDNAANFWGVSPVGDNPSMVAWYDSIDLTTDPSTNTD